jgi:hypothetical protein
MARSSRQPDSPSCFLILLAVFGSISRDGTVVTRSPTKTIIWPPFPRHFSARNVRPFRRAPQFGDEFVALIHRPRFSADLIRTNMSERQAPPIVHASRLDNSVDSFLIDRFDGKGSDRTEEKEKGADFQKKPAHLPRWRERAALPPRNYDLVNQFYFVLQTSDFVLHMQLFTLQLCDLEVVGRRMQQRFADFQLERLVPSLEFRKMRINRHRGISPCVSDCCLTPSLYACVPDRLAILLGSFLAKSYIKRPAIPVVHSNSQGCGQGLSGSNQKAIIHNDLPVLMVPA